MRRFSRFGSNTAVFLGTFSPPANPFFAIDPSSPPGTVSTTC